MNFQIKKLIIWPRKNQFSPRTINFHLGKVNVITGSSRTGKSAIIPIIDYCLGSSTCSIPIEIIRDNASWYGIIVQTSLEKILIARKVPDGIKVSQEFFVSRGNLINIPNNIEKNQNLDGIKEILNTISGVPYVSRDGYAYNERLSFRDITHLIFQTQDIIANQNILFYKTHQTENREKLKNWFPFILGAETVDIIDARKELKDLELELRRQQKEYDNAVTISNSWLQNIIGQLHVAREYGLYNGELPSDDDKENLLIIAQDIINSAPSSPQSNIESLSRAAKEIRELELQEDELSSNIAILSKRLKDVEELKSSICSYHESAKRKIERLGISRWIKEYSSSINCCPICGSVEHPIAFEEIEKICSVVEQYESQSINPTQIPAAFDREYKTLRTDLKNLIDKKNDLQHRFDLLRARNKEAAEYQQRTKDMFLFLGQLTSTIDLVKRMTETGGLEDKLELTKERIKYISEILSKANVEKSIERSLNEISIHTLERLKMLDVDSAYRVIPPKFSIKELNLEVQDKNGVWHLLGEVGSASNWVSFHLAFSCAMQEYFINQSSSQSIVPSFIIYDQPSQVYFPRLKKDEQLDDPEYQDEDVEAVRSMFKTLAASVNSTGEKWQAIVLDHARSDIYGDIDGVIEIEEWRNGEKLIPEFWYS
jgi:Skp family chaperone for outer membrane proteins